MEDQCVEEKRRVALPKSLNVLVVDDHPINLKFLSEQLKSLGHRVTTAENGTEALLKYHKNTFQLVLTDIHMPEMDGYSLAAALRREKSMERVVILGITADASEEEKRACLQSGMNDCLTKPVTSEMLTAALNHFVVLEEA